VSHAIRMLSDISVIGRDPLDMSLGNCRPQAVTEDLKFTAGKQSFELDDVEMPDVGCTFTRAFDTDQIARAKTIHTVISSSWTMDLISRRNSECFIR